MGRKVPISQNCRSLIHKPTIGIHCWGGLGSQLHAWHLLELLQLWNPKRSFQLIFHTSGITRRLPEIETYLDSSQFREIDDFRIHTSRDKVIRLFYLPNTPLLRKIIKRILFFLAIENNLDSLEKLARIKPWTKSIRGHYSQISIDSRALESMSKKIFSSNISDSVVENENLVIHLRLGDLRGLISKSPINKEHLSSILNDFLEKYRIQNIIIHSDSPDSVLDYINFNFNGSVVVKRFDTNSLSALIEMVESKYFIGTSSKLSLWACIFRSKFRKDYTFIPQHFSSTIEALLGNSKSKNIQFYG